MLESTAFLAEERWHDAIGLCSVGGLRLGRGAWAQDAGGATAVKGGVEYVKAGHLFDSVTGKYRENAVLVVEGERIRSVEAGGFAVPAGAKVVDLSGRMCCRG